MKMQQFHENPHISIFTLHWLFKMENQRTKYIINEKIQRIGITANIYCAYIEAVSLFFFIVCHVYMRICYPTDHSVLCEFYLNRFFGWTIENQWWIFRARCKYQIKTNIYANNSLSSNSKMETIQHLRKSLSTELWALRKSCAHKRRK